MTLFWTLFCFAAAACKCSFCDDIFNLLLLLVLWLLYYCTFFFVGSLNLGTLIKWLWLLYMRIVT
jgi:hypothetical protein